MKPTVRAIPLATKGYFPIHPTYNPVLWHLELVLDSRRTIGPFVTLAKAEEYAKENGYPLEERENA